LTHQRLNAVFFEIEIEPSKHEFLASWCEKMGFILVDQEEIEFMAKPKLIVNFLTDQGI
jgi:A/G-specific adenine glycosylase